MLPGPQGKDGERNKSHLCHPSTCNGLQENLPLSTTFVAVLPVCPVPTRGSGSIEDQLEGTH